MVFKILIMKFPILLLSPYLVFSCKKVKTLVLVSTKIERPFATKIITIILNIFVIIANTSVLKSSAIVAIYIPKYWKKLFQSFIISCIF